MFVRVVIWIPEGPVGFLCRDGQGRLGDGDALPWQGRKVRWRKGCASRLPRSPLPLPVSMLSLAMAVPLSSTASHGMVSPSGGTSNTSPGTSSVDNMASVSARKEAGLQFWGICHWSGKGGSGLQSFGPPTTAKGLRSNPSPTWGPDAPLGWCFPLQTEAQRLES